MKYRNIIILTTLCFTSLTAFAAFPIHPFSATYSLYHNGKQLALTHKKLTVNNKSYTYVANTNAHVLFFKRHIVESSQGEITPGGLHPKQYSVTTNNKLTFQHTHFTKNLQDNMSQALMLRYNLIINKKPKVINAISQKGIQTLNFHIKAKNIQKKTKLGNLNTIEIVYVDNKGDTIDNWLAPKYNYLPVVTKIYTNGKLSFSAYLESFNK